MPRGRGLSRPCVLCLSRVPEEQTCSWTTNPHRSNEWIAALAGGDRAFANELRARVSFRLRNFLCTDHFHPDDFRQMKLLTSAVPRRIGLNVPSNPIEHDHTYAKGWRRPALTSGVITCKREAVDSREMELCEVKEESVCEWHDLTTDVKEEPAEREEEARVQVWCKPEPES